MKIETTTRRYDALAARLIALPLSSLPEIPEMSADHGLPGYLAWLMKETSA